MTDEVRQITTRFRSYSYEAMVRAEWGPEYSRPDIAYNFHGRTFESTDRNQSGIYDFRICPLWDRDLSMWDLGSSRWCQ